MEEIKDFRQVIKIVRRFNKSLIMLPFYTNAKYLGSYEWECYQLYLTKNNKFIWVYNNGCSCGEPYGKDIVCNKFNLEMVPMKEFDTIPDEWISDVIAELKDIIDEYIDEKKHDIDALESNKRIIGWDYYDNKGIRTELLASCSRLPEAIYKDKTEDEIHKDLFKASKLQKIINQVEKYINGGD